MREVQEEIDITYTADMTDPNNGISAAAAKRIWSSLPKQLLRASTTKFEYSEVMRRGRRSQLLEPLGWFEAAGVVLRYGVHLGMLPKTYKEAAFTSDSPSTHRWQIEPDVTSAK